MKPLPGPETYEGELKYWPYRESLKTVIEIVASRAPKNAKVLDLMCGPGYLVGQLLEQRPDLSLLGVDIEGNYVQYAIAKYPKASFEVGDVLVWQTERKFDTVMCTGALHHIPYERQEEVIRSMAHWLKPEGFAIISDCYIDDYSTELERKLGAARLGYEYLRATIQNGAPNHVIEPCVDIIANDILMDEFKTSFEKRLPVMGKHFDNGNHIKIWPNHNITGYGDYISVLKRPRRSVEGKIK